jgi:hypothetical protein
MAIDWAVIIDKVPSVAILLVFVWFTRDMVKSYRQNARDVMDGWKEYLNAQNVSWQQFIDHRDELYLERLDASNQSHTGQLENLSQELCEQTKAMTKMVGQMDAHGDLLKFIAEDVKEGRDSGG